MIAYSCRDNYIFFMNTNRTTNRSLDDSVGFNLFRAAQLYRRELIHVLDEYDLTPEQWQVLAVLSSVKERITQGEIATLIFKDKHSISRMLDRMENTGWIKRHPHQTDTRATDVFLGERRSEISGIRVMLQKHFERIDSVLTDWQRCELLTALKLLRTHLGDSNISQKKDIL